MPKYIVLEIEADEEEVISIQAHKIYNSIKAAQQWIANHLEASREYVKGCQKASNFNIGFLLRNGASESLAYIIDTQYRLWGEKGAIEYSTRCSINLSKIELKTLVSNPKRPVINGFNLYCCELPTNGKVTRETRNVCNS